MYVCMYINNDMCTMDRETCMYYYRHKLCFLQDRPSFVWHIVHSDPILVPS
jgi:hypothetical protein